MSDETTGTMKTQKRPSYLHQLLASFRRLPQNKGSEWKETIEEKSIFAERNETEEEQPASSSNSYQSIENLSSGSEDKEGSPNASDDTCGKSERINTMAHEMPIEETLPKHVPSEQECSNEDTSSQTDFESMGSYDSSSHSLNDNSYEADEVSNSLVEEYVEENGKYFKASLLRSQEEGKWDYHCDEENLDASQCYMSNGNLLYGWSGISDENRNEIYDKWMNDLVTWERYRLMWLDKVSLIDGFPRLYKDRTFLVRKDNWSNSETNHEANRGKNIGFLKGLQRTKVNAMEKGENSQEAQEVETIFQSEDEESCLDDRLQRHLLLHNLGLPNCYEQLSKKKTTEHMESCHGESLNAEQETAPQRIGCSLLEEISFDDILVYKFTDRNLWRRHNEDYCLEESD